MAENRVFLDRAQQLEYSREFLGDDEGCSAAIGLLAIHTAIALNDALLVSLTGKRVKGTNHAQAAEATEKVVHRGDSAGAV